MKFIGRALPSSGKKLGGKLSADGKTLGMKLQSRPSSDRHFIQPEQREVRSDLERGSSTRNPMTGNAHHIPRDGQFALKHDLAPDRKAWQRKKNH